ncbi:MAG: phospholipid carrier-dependent glycosyltransferase [Anaerolineales bacterium]|uniref:Phospholipid carrier-dependent glycosyltransferase n=1 Tax=Candidatus Desulfolinea nitratireducens TaxID=2841698 RepID=A0A8J6NJZ5_9CHLR|nr:phospholipid carrier-dependent glycosyltransferase [Candidatus Desulfolinea nitratireducens]
MKTSIFFQKYEKWTPILLALLFILLTASGLATMHNPDELVHRVEHALGGWWEFDETNFDYPSLPKYVMFGVGKIVYALDYADDFKNVARFLSVLLGAGTIYLVYLIVRNMGGGILASSFASLFLLSNHILAINARFAHNDLYLTFFLTLTVYFLVKYQKTMLKGWLYGAFFCVGLAASSKYNGGVFLLVPLLIYVYSEGKKLYLEKFRTLETLFIAITLSFLGFALGTPKALLWMSYYFKRVIPVLSNHASYGKTAESVTGLFGQWGIMKTTLGAPAYYLFLLAFLYFAIKFFLSLRRSEGKENKNLTPLILLAILVFDLPIMVSYNYQARFFIPLMPFFAVLAALFIDDLQAHIQKSNYSKYHILLPLALGLMIFFSFLRVLSVRLLIENDPRNVASEFIATLPSGTKLEYTMYPPEIPANHFEDEYSYPIFFTKFEGQEVPEVGWGKPYKKFNEGEEGLLNRDTDYFVVDSFTYARCENEAIYQTNPVECDFFEKLLAGETSYQLIGDFSYTLPKLLPQISISFVNPEIQVFQRSE